MLQYHKGRWWRGDVGFSFGPVHGIYTPCGPGGENQILEVWTNHLRLFTLREGMLVGVTVRKVSGGGR